MSKNETKTKKSKSNGPNIEHLKTKKPAPATAPVTVAPDLLKATDWNLYHSVADALKSKDKIFYITTDCLNRTVHIPARHDDKNLSSKILSAVSYRQYPPIPINEKGNIGREGNQRYIHITKNLKQTYIKATFFHSEKINNLNDAKNETLQSWIELNVIDPPDALIESDIENLFLINDMIKIFNKIYAQKEFKFENLTTIGTDIMNIGLPTIAKTTISKLHNDKAFINSLSKEKQTQLLDDIEGASAYEVGEYISELKTDKQKTTDVWDNTETNDPTKATEPTTDAPAKPATDAPAKPTKAKKKGTNANVNQIHDDFGIPSLFYNAATKEVIEKEALKQTTFKPKDISISIYIEKHAPLCDRDYIYISALIGIDFHIKGTKNVMTKLKKFINAYFGLKAPATKKAPAKKAPAKKAPATKKAPAKKAPAKKAPAKKAPATKK